VKRQFPFYGHVAVLTLRPEAADQHRRGPIQARRQEVRGGVLQEHDHRVAQQGAVGCSLRAQLSLSANNGRRVPALVNERSRCKITWFRAAWQRRREHTELQTLLGCSMPFQNATAPPPVESYGSATKPHPVSNATTP